MTLYDFYATWCGPCKMMTPIVDQLEQERPDITIVRVDIDQHPAKVKEFGIQSVPTFVLQSGTTETRIVGAMPKPRFLSELGLDN